MELHDNCTFKILFAGYLLLVADKSNSFAPSQNLRTSLFFLIKLIEYPILTSNQKPVTSNLMNY